MSTIKTKWLIIFTGLCLSSLVVAESFELPIKHRQALMSSVRSHFSTLYSLLEQPQLDTVSVQFHAKQLSNLTSFLESHYSTLFIKGSTHEDSAAKETIWSEGDEFSQKMKAFNANANQFLLASQSGKKESIEKAFKVLRKECGGCHKKFKIKN